MRNLRGAIPPTSGPRTQVVRVQSTTGQLYYILSDAPWGAYFHWTGKTSRECTDQTARGEHCERCKAKVPIKWRAYVHVLNCESRETEILEITLAALNKLFDQIPEGETLRGKKIAIGKTKGGKRGRFWVNVQAYQQLESGKLPPEQDPAPVLKTLWRWNDKPIADSVS